MKHQLIGGERNGEIVEALYPVSELVFPSSPDISFAVQLTEDPARVSNHLRYTRREIPHKDKFVAVYASSDMTDEQVVAAVSR